MIKLLIGMLEISIEHKSAFAKISNWCAQHHVKEVLLGSNRGRAYVLPSGEILHCYGGQIFFKGQKAHCGYFDWKEAKQILAI